MKRIIITLSFLVVSCSLFAQARAQTDTMSAPIPEEIQAIRTASSLAMYGYKYESASALVEAAKIFNSVPTQEMIIGEGSSETNEITPGSGVSFDPRQLIADAKEMAGKDKELKKYIQKVEKTIGRSKRGAVDGPFIKTSMVLPFAKDRYYVKFAGGRKATVFLEGTDLTDLNLYVYDSNNNLICRDTGPSSECSLYFTPYWDDFFIIVVVNTDILPNPYLLLTN